MNNGVGAENESELRGEGGRGDRQGLRVQRTGSNAWPGHLLAVLMFIHLDICPVAKGLEEQAR